MTPELQLTLHASGIRRPPMRNHIPCMAHLIQLALCAFMSNLSVKGCTRSWEANERDQQFGENESTNIGKSHSLRKEGNAWINKVSAMRPALAKIIKTVCISRHFERPETYYYIAKNACCVDYAATWSSKQVHRQSEDHSTNSSTTDYVFPNTVEFYSRVAWASLPITRIHPGAAEESKIQRLLATLNDTGWMDNRQVRYGSYEGILILDPVDVEKAYNYSASCHHCLQWHVRSYGWRYMSFG